MVFIALLKSEVASFTVLCCEIKNVLYINVYAAIGGKSRL